MNDNMGTALWGSFIVIVIILAFVGCGIFMYNHEQKVAKIHEQYNSEFQNIKIFMESPHELRRVNTFMNQKGEIHGSAFFVLAFGGGSINGWTKTVKMATFAWRHSDGEYILSSFPMEDIRFNIDDTIKIPTVSFIIYDITSCTNGSGKNEIIEYYRKKDYQILIDGFGSSCQSCTDNWSNKRNHIFKAIVRINSKDWPIDVRKFNDLP